MPMIPIRSATKLLVLTSSLIAAKTIHFDPAYLAADADGSTEHPFATLDKCFTTALPGEVCQLEPGDYNLATPAGGNIGRVTKSGTASAPIRVEARLPGTAFIGSWHELNWVSAGSTNLWTGSLKVPLSATVAALQGVWAGRLNQSGVRVWYLGRHAALQPATWPHSDGVFPRTAILQTGTSNTSYELTGLPAGNFIGAKAHAFRDDEQGAVLRKVVFKTGPTTIGINPEGNDDQLSAFGGKHRVWLSDHPDLVTSSDLGRWAVDPATGNVRLSYSFDPTATSFVLQVDGVGPDLSGAAYWTFRNLNFMGVVPVTDAASTGLRFDGVTFDRVGLNDGNKDFDAGIAVRTGLVLQGAANVVERSYFSVCPLNCIEIIGAGAKVNNNMFSYSQVQAGAYSGAVHVLGAGAEIRHNMFTELGGSAVVLNAGASNARVSRNRIELWGRMSASRHGGVAALFKTTSAVEIDSNVIVGEAPIDPTQSNPRPGAGINLLYGRNMVFAHHNIVDAGKVGFRLGGWDDPSHTADNNSFDNKFLSNTFGPALTYSWLKTTPSATPFTGTRLANNIYRTQAGVQFDPFFNNISAVSPNDYLTGGTVDHNLVPGQDPLFIAPFADDWNFGPLAGSPAIDAGVGYTLPNGTALKFLSTAPDIGAVEYGTTWAAGIEPYVPPATTTAFSLDDPSIWTIPSDEAVVATSTKTEGAAAFDIPAVGYRILESPVVNQTAVGGLSFVSLDALISTIQSNAWWVGAVQVYVECPSRGLWNQWVGQWELTGRVQGDWQTLRLPLPSNIAQQLQGASYNDLKVRIAVNLNPGSGSLKLDNFRFEP